jgi:hypothetical protein
VRAAQARVGGVGHGRQPLGLKLPQRVDDDALAQRVVARAQVVDRERLHHAFQNLPARDDDLRALLADARHRPPLLRAHRRETLVQLFQLTQRDLGARRLRALLGPSPVAQRAAAQDLADRDDGAGGSGRVLPARARQFPRRSFERGTYLPAQRAQLLPRGRVARDEPLGESDRAELDREEFDRHAVLHQRDFGRAAADVHVDERGALRPRAAVRRGDADEPRLLDAR